MIGLGCDGVSVRDWVKVRVTIFDVATSDCNQKIVGLRKVDLQLTSCDLDEIIKDW